MIAVGFDIGTTNISAVVSDTEQKTTLKSFTIPNRSVIPSQNEWEHIQDPNQIVDTCFQLLASIRAEFSQIDVIGITGQMHGILYTDQDGFARSPLFTWRDQRSALQYNEECTFAQYLSKTTGYVVAPGYGLGTHKWNTENGVCPKEAFKLTTIGGYVAMRFTGRKTPLLHCSEAASLSLFSVQNNSFDFVVLKKVGIDSRILPEVTDRSMLLGSIDGIPVSVSIGDNQASFLGSMQAEDSNRILFNLGTGGQISLCSDYPLAPGKDFECRPYINHKYLAVGSSLCGGKAYAILEAFFRNCLAVFGVPSTSDLFDKMNDLCDCGEVRCPEFLPLFSGKRSCPQAAAEIREITEQNFTAKDLVNALVRGMIKELHEYYLEMIPMLNDSPTLIVCSGNAIGRNRKLLSIISDSFSLPAVLTSVKEEAAFGAALFASQCN